MPSQNVWTLEYWNRGLSSPSKVVTLKKVFTRIHRKLKMSTKIHQNRRIPPLEISPRIRPFWKKMCPLKFTLHEDSPFLPSKHVIEIKVKWLHFNFKLLVKRWSEALKLIHLLWKSWLSLICPSFLPFLTIKLIHFLWTPLLTPILPKFFAFFSP